MKEIKLGGKIITGRVTLVDDEDYERVCGHTWSARQHPRTKAIYAVASIKVNGGPKRITVQLSRLIMNITDPKLLVDHINGNPSTLDNRKQNLRVVNTQINSLNSNQHRNNGSGYQGIKFRRRNKYRKYEGFLTIDGKDIYVGAFETAKEAGESITAYKKKILEQKLEEFHKANPHLNTHLIKTV